MGKQRHDQGQKKRLLSRNDRADRGDDDTDAMARRLFRTGLASAGIFGGERASKPRRTER